MNSITILDENDKSELNQNISTKSPKLHTHTTDDIEGIFTVASGGIGVGSLDANKVLYAASESAIGEMSIPTAKSILMQNDSGAPYWKHVSDVDDSTKSIITLTGYSGTSYTVTNNDGERYTGTIGSSESAIVKVSGFGIYTINLNYSGTVRNKKITINNIGMYTVDCYIAVFNNASYSEISTASRNGSAASMWSIGDAKAVVLNGTVGSYNFSNETTYMFIAAFDHNSSVEMNGAHHMICSFAKSAATGGKDVAFVDSGYGNSMDGAGFYIDPSSAYNSTWRDTYMRNTICSQFKNAMPSALQSVLRSRTIYTGTANVDQSSGIVATTDTVYIPSEFEVYGSIHYSHSYEQDYQQQLAYYRNGASKVRYRSNATSTAGGWWLRSPCFKYTIVFCYVNKYGGSRQGQYIWSQGFAPLITI